MSNVEEKSPYYSKDFEISAVTSPKEYNGFLKRHIIIKYGNQQERVIVKESDVLDPVFNKTMISELAELWNALTSWAKDNNVIFIDEIRHRSNYKDEIIHGVKEEPKKVGVKKE
jgi:hypothetical protein